MNEIEKFKQEVGEGITAQGSNTALQQAAATFMDASIRSRYSYHFTWMGRPIIQYPQDVMAMQEVIWAVQPDLIIETGIAHGGSLIYYASLLELTGKGHILGIDIDIRPHNKAEIENHPMSKRITMYQGSSIAPETIEKVKAFAKGYEKILVVLDSNHTHQHVLDELRAYADLVAVGSYCVVFDTVVEDLPQGLYSGNRPWDIGNNPKTAVAEFMQTNNDFVVDTGIDNKLLISVAPGGYLKRVK
jgi:cephalosporin hydroxylase